MPPEPVVPEPTPGDDAAAAVARELLAEVVRIVTRRPEQLEDAAIKERLANALTHGEKLRRELRDAGEELAAVKVERDGLRQRLRLSEANLNKALGDPGKRFIDEEVRKHVDRLMQAKPGTAKGGDDEG